MGIDCVLYILSCVFIIENELHPHRPSSNIKFTDLSAHMVGVEARESLCTAAGWYVYISLAIDGY